MLRNPLMLLWLYKCACAASRYGATSGAPGREFGRFGRQLGLRLLVKGSRASLGYLLTPVNIVRYFEFPFVLSCLPEPLGRCLDVSSPRLFSLYVGYRNPAARILMINPDVKDISETGAIISKLGINSIRVACRGVHVLSHQTETYDCIWSISVIEHICGGYDDRYAVKLMYDSLNSNGRLILTVPVGREFRNEWRDSNCYGTHGSQSGGKYFFQRFYDKAAIWGRLLSPIGKEPTVVRWFGETSAGRFSEYEQRWMREGYKCTVEDPREIADNYQEFATWEEMPGMGVCGLMVEKTRS